MRYNQTKLNLIPSKSCVIQFISLVLSTVVMMSCGPPEERRFSQQDASIVMVGTLSAEALTAVMSYSVYSSPSVRGLITSSDDAAAYLKSAKFNVNLAQALINMLSKETSGDLNMRMEAWNEINSKLSKEAKRVSPRIGSDLYNFGLSLHMVSLAFASGPDRSLPEQQRVRAYRSMLATPIAEHLFPSGHKIPLPEKMAMTLTTAEMTDLSNLEGCKEFGRKLNQLERMLRATALYGVASLEKF